MTTPQTSDLTPEQLALRHKHRIRWWVLAVSFTIVCAAAPLLMQGKTGSVIWICAMLACGATLGGLNHSRPWRWGVLLSATFFVEAIVVGGVFDLLDLLDKLRFGVTLAIPGFIGCYGGAFVRKLVTHRIHLTGEPESIRYWKAAVGFGFAAGALALITGTAQSVPIPSMIVILSAATAIAYLKPQRLWRWVLAMAPGVPLAVALQIIVEVSRDGTTHDLYPLELGIAVLYAVVPALAGTIMGRVIKTGSVLQPPSESPTYS